jgi:hypothetical protein
MCGALEAFMNGCGAEALTALGQTECVCEPGPNCDHDNCPEESTRPITKESINATFAPLCTNCAFLFIEVGVNMDRASGGPYDFEKKTVLPPAACGAFANFTAGCPAEGFGAIGAEECTCDDCDPDMCPEDKKVTLTKAKFTEQMKAKCTQCDGIMFDMFEAQGEAYRNAEGPGGKFDFTATCEKYVEFQTECAGEAPNEHTGYDSVEDAVDECSECMKLEAKLVNGQRCKREPTYKYKDTSECDSRDGTPGKDWCTWEEYDAQPDKEEPNPACSAPGGDVEPCTTLQTIKDTCTSEDFEGNTPSLLKTMGAASIDSATQDLDSGVC